MCSFVQLSTCLKYSSYYCLLAIMKEIKKHILYHVNHHFFFTFATLIDLTLYGW